MTDRRDAGVSFIELLVAIVLLGTAGVAVLVSMSAAAVGARTSDEIADVQSLLAQAIVVMGDTDPELVPYVACDAGSDVLTAYQGAVGATFADTRVGQVDVVAVRFWNPSTATFGASCGYGVGDRLQEVEIAVSFAQTTRSAKVIKRPLVAPTAGLGDIPEPPEGPIGPGFSDIELTPGING